MSDTFESGPKQGFIIVKAHPFGKPLFRLKQAFN